MAGRPSCTNRQSRFEDNVGENSKLVVNLKKPGLDLFSCAYCVLPCFAGVFHSEQFLALCFAPRGALQSPSPCRG